MNKQNHTFSFLHCFFEILNKLIPLLPSFIVVDRKFLVYKLLP